MVMEPYNPPQDPWLVILYQDEHIMGGQQAKRPVVRAGASG